MGITSLILGILSISGVCISLIPLLNILNCGTLPLALLGAILGLVDLLRPKPEGAGRGAAIAGFVLCLLALIIGGTRFVISLFSTGGVL